MRMLQGITRREGYFAHHRERKTCVNFPSEASPFELTQGITAVAALV